MPKEFISILEDAMDIHVHCSPDVTPRSQDLVQLSHSASKSGMRGILLKDHNTSTVGRVYTLNKLFQNKIHFYSSLVLNFSVGGLNPLAVESALRSGVDVIFFPTYSAYNHINSVDSNQHPGDFSPSGLRTSGISILDNNGRLKSVVIDIIKLINQYDGVLATGHLSPNEILTLIKKAKKYTVSRILVTHASEYIPGMSIEQQKKAVKYGAFIEHCFYALTSICTKPASLNDIKTQILAVGTDHVILSSDFGQIENGPIVEGFLSYLEKLYNSGFSFDQLKIMISKNPRTLLDK